MTGTLSQPAQPASMLPRGWRMGSRMALAAAGVYLLLHLLTLAAFAGHAKLLSYGFLTAAPLLGGAASLISARRRGAALNWHGLATGLVLWAAGMSATMYMDVFAPEGGVVSGLATLLYVLYGVPLTFVVASPSDEAWQIRLVDAALALALGALFFACTFTFATVTSTDDAGFSNIRLMFDVQNAFIAGFTYVRYKASRDPAQRDFFRLAASFSALYMMAAAYINHVEMDTDFGVVTDLVIDIPFLALFVMTAQRVADPLETVSNLPSSAFSTIVRTASPIMLPLTLFAVSCFMIFHSPWLAIAGFVAALAGYSLRNILVELRSQADKRRLEQLSRIDPLTQLANRRAFDEALAREFARSRRSGHSLSLLMIDIDHFKMLNDAYGHPEGDRYLHEVSRTLAALVSRASDMAARYGGEEFAVILPDTDGTAAMRVAHSLLGAVIGLALPSPASRGIVTVSIGLAATDCMYAEDVSQFLGAADAALYAAKQSGRNQVVQGGPLKHPVAAAS